VLAIDKDADRVQSIANKVTHAVEADATDEEALKTLGVRNFDVAVVSIGDNISANILCTLILKELNVPYVIVKAPDTLHGKVLTKVGADRVIYPERDMGVRIAHNLISSNVLDYIEFAPEYGVIEIIATSKMIGKTLKELQFRSEFNVNVMAIKRGEDLHISPGANDKILEGDRLVLMGKNESLDKIKKYND
jgi:trk system potassium uptake protein TrkA